MPFLRNITSGLVIVPKGAGRPRVSRRSFRAYQDMAAEEKMKDGMTRKEALRAVRLEREASKSSKEIVRSVRLGILSRDVLQDLRFARRCSARTWLHCRRRPHPCARHWRQHRHLQSGRYVLLRVLRSKILSNFCHSCHAAEGWHSRRFPYATFEALRDHNSSLSGCSQWDSSRVNAVLNGQAELTDVDYRFRQLLDVLASQRFSAGLSMRMMISRGKTRPR